MALPQQPTPLIPECDELRVDVLVKDGHKEPGTRRFFRDGVEVFNYTTEEALQLLREGWTVREEPA